MQTKILRNIAILGAILLCDTHVNAASTTPVSCSLWMSSSSGDPTSHCQPSTACLVSKWENAALATCDSVAQLFVSDGYTGPCENKEWNVYYYHEETKPAGECYTVNPTPEKAGGN